ncbi:MAG: cation-transporting P-type ATPase [Vicinamibacterales bacterium]
MDSSGSAVTTIRVHRSPTVMAILAFCRCRQRVTSPPSTRSTSGANAWAREERRTRDARVRAARRRRERHDGRRANFPAPRTRRPASAGSRRRAPVARSVKARSMPMPATPDAVPGRPRVPGPPSLAPDAPWARPWADVARGLGVSREHGLAEAEAAARRHEVGTNRLREPRRTGVLEVLVNQFRSVILLLLAGAAGISAVLGDWVETAAIVAVIVLNAAIGFVTEWQAVRSMEALRRLERVHARVRRGGRVLELPADQLVPGDFILIEGGDVVTADLRVVEASKLQVDESLLTGESLPVGKRPDPVARDAGVADRTAMLFKGTLVTRGSGEGLVVATGMRTELGTIASLTAEARQASTPLERRLERLGQRLIVVTLGIAAAVAVAGVLAGRPVGLMVETAIALAVAAIPEGLPIVATLALARGMLRMAHRNAIVQRLSAVETLGATSVICTDKTGTLTRNELTVTHVWTAAGLARMPEETGELAPAARARVEPVLVAGALCNNAAVGPDGASVGDPLEAALLRAATIAGVDRAALLRERPEAREEAFDPGTKMMATFHRAGGAAYTIAVKGAPEAVFEACATVAAPDGDRPMDVGERAEWLARVDELADDGCRVLALADGRTSDATASPYHGLRLLGLIGFLDPPRHDATAALAACRRAGIQVVMVTGDQPRTARSIARAIDLAGEDGVEVLRGEDIPRIAGQPDALRRARIFARVTPRQKLDLIEAFQRAGHVVAMTGDGVNDAPALKKADIGVAMGRRGTQVAREAADMVLEDDAFDTIVAAIRQGRAIFGNIRRFVVYLLSCNISEVLLIAAASATTAPLPILPLQILFLNLVTDVFPALALGLGEGAAGIMTRPPRPATEQILMRDHWIAMAGWAALITASVAGAFWLALARLHLPEPEAVTVSFLTLAFAQLWHVFNTRGPRSRLLRNDVVGNPWVWGALALCTLLLVAAVFVPPFARLLRVASPGAAGWLVVVAMSLAPVLAGQIVLAFRGRRARATGTVRSARARTTR